MIKLDFPNRITIELTNSCNVSCTFCPRQDMCMEIGYMQDDLFYRLIDEASHYLPVKLVLFFRGESLLHPHFIEFVKYAKKKGIGPIQFATNALAMEPQISDQIICAGLDFISFSLDTLDQSIYCKSRLTGDLKKSMENVMYLCDQSKKRLEEGMNAPVIQVSTIEVDDYMDGQESFIDYWKQYVDFVRVYYEHDDKGKFRNEAVQKELEKEVSERQPCRKVFTDFLVYWNGDLALCNYDWRGGLKSINVREMSIKEAWNSEEYETVRNMHLQNNFTDIMCKDCQHWRIDYTKNGFLGKTYEGTLGDIRGRARS